MLSTGIPFLKNTADATMIIDEFTAQPSPIDNMVSIFSKRISFIFSSLQRHQIYGDTEKAKYYYSVIGKMPWASGENALACEECGECLEKCPQGIAIIDQLKKAHDILAN